jgi:hypothetical protein
VLESREEEVDRPEELKFVTSSTVVKLSTGKDDIGLKIRDVQNDDHDLKQVLGWVKSKQKPVFEDIRCLGHVI